MGLLAVRFQPHNPASGGGGYGLAARLLPEVSPSAITITTSIPATSAARPQPEVLGASHTSGPGVLVGVGVAPGTGVDVGFGTAVGVGVGAPGTGVAVGAGVGVGDRRVAGVDMVAEDK